MMYCGKKLLFIKKMFNNYLNSIGASASVPRSGENNLVEFHFTCKLLIPRLFAKKNNFTLHIRLSHDRENSGIWNFYGKVLEEEGILWERDFMGKQ
jgi:hypothetical protein